MKCANHGPLLAAIMIIAYLERESLVHAYVGVRVRARAQVDTPTGGGDAASAEGEEQSRRLANYRPLLIT